MKVQVLDDNGNLIWERDQENNYGLASRKHLEDGIQNKIIQNLRHALEQAEGQSSTLLIPAEIDPLAFENIDGVSDISTSPTQV